MSENHSLVLRRCYIASPLGFTVAGRDYYQRIMLPALSRVIIVVDPWSLVTSEEFEAARTEGREREFSLEIAERNADAIRSCSLLCASLDGQEVDSGTASEVGYASALGLICYGLRGDHRQSGEPGMAVNLQVEGFIVQSGGYIVRSLDELVAALADAPASIIPAGLTVPSTL